MISVLTCPPRFFIAFGFTTVENITSITTHSTPQELTSAVSANVSNQETTTQSPLGDTTLLSVSQDTSGTTTAISGKVLVSGPRGLLLVPG